MERVRLNEFTNNFLASASQMAYVEEAHGTLMLLENFNEVFRYLIREETTVTLYNEIDILLKYIIIQKMRYGDRLSMNLPNDSIYKAMFIKHLSLLSFLDSLICEALECCEISVAITVSMNTDKENSVKVIVDKDNSREEFVKII